MTIQRRLMCILAHPDDESLGLGGILAKYAAEGVETHLVTATRGERGWSGDDRDYPGPTALGQMRERELQAAAAVLGLHSMRFLDYQDGELDQAEPADAIGRIVAHLRRVRPQVVVTFDPTGIYGHPDHIAICQFTTAAMAAAANPRFDAPGAPHQVSKLYYLAETEEKFADYQKVFGELAVNVDGIQRRAVGWRPWSITTCIDTAAYWRTVWQAVMCHRSQLSTAQGLAELPAAQRRNLCATQSFYRVFSLVNGGRAVEHDLFAGLREHGVD